MLRKATLRALAALALGSFAAAQEIVLIAEESFDYPNGAGLHDQTGGVGWANAWWSNGDPLNSGVAAFDPSLDGIGSKAVDVLGDTGAFRFPSVAGFEHMVDGSLLFGNDGTTVWISFLIQRAPGGDDTYGGFSLIQQFVAEELFIGCPGSQESWGIHDDPNGTPNAQTIFGTDPDVLTRFVVRIDFEAGDERLRLWLDPPTDFPDTAADIDTAVHDFRFNEVRVQSGGGTVHGYYFDAIRMHTYAEGAGTPYCFGDGSGAPCPCGNEDISNPGTGGCVNGSGAGAILSATGSDSVAAANFTLWCRNLLPNQPALFFQGDNASAGGAGIFFGDGLRCAGQNVRRLQVITPNSLGNAHTTIDIAMKGAVTGGDTKYYQCWYRNPGTSTCGSNFNLSNGIEFTWVP